jgi:hypothetical protein
MKNQIQDIPETLTLRDWFAGQALSGMRDLKGGYFSTQDLENGHADRVAVWAAEAAYRYADAMLAERTLVTHE